MTAIPTDTVPIDTFLGEEGYRHDEARHLARAVLEEAGLTRTGKTGMVAAKLDRARDALTARQSATRIASRCTVAASRRSPAR